MTGPVDAAGPDSATDGATMDAGLDASNAGHALQFSGGNYVFMTWLAAARRRVPSAQGGVTPRDWLTWTRACTSGAVRLEETTS